MCNPYLTQPAELILVPFCPVVVRCDFGNPHPDVSVAPNAVVQASQCTNMQICVDRRKGSRAHHKMYVLFLEWGLQTRKAKTFKAKTRQELRVSSVKSGYKPQEQDETVHLAQGFSHCLYEQR